MATLRLCRILLTFATDTPNEIDDITYSGPEDAEGISPSYHVVFEPIFRLKDDKRSLHQSDMLFTFGDCQNHVPNIFQNWLYFTERTQSFCTVYFANVYAEPRYLNDRFVSLMRAFALLSTALGEVSDAHTALPKRGRSIVKIALWRRRPRAPLPHHPNRTRDRDALSPTPSASRKCGYDGTARWGHAWLCESGMRHLGLFRASVRGKRPSHRRARASYMRC